VRNFTQQLLEFFIVLLHFHSSSPPLSSCNLLQGRALFTSLENATPSSAAAIYNNTETERDDDDVRSSSSRLHCGDRLSSAHQIFWLILYTIETSQMIDGRKGTAAAEAGRRRSKNELSLELQKQNGNTNASNCDLLLTKFIASSYLLLLARHSF
jgi:hypothetical protein